MPEMSLEELAKQFGRQIPWANKSLPEATQERLQQIDGQGLRDPVANVAAHAISLHPAVQLAMGALPLVTNPNRDTFQNALDTIQNTSLGGKVGSEAMVPTLANLKRFEALKQSIYNRMVKQESPELSEAGSYFKVRYPRHANAIDDVQITPNLQARGEYFPENNEIAINPYDRLGEKAPSQDLINTFAHETTHAVDHQRKGLGFVDEGRTKFESVLSANKNLPIPDIIELYNRIVPSEARAYQAGGTAEAGYQKYLDLKNRPVDPMMQSTTPPPPTSTPKPLWQTLLDRARPRNTNPTYR